MQSKLAWQKALLGLLFLLILAAAALPRLARLDQYVTPDEPKWLLRAGNFYSALFHRDWAATYQKEHPGVTVMWLGAVGYLRSFPAFAGMQPGEIAGITALEGFLARQGTSALSVLVSGRQLVTLAGLLVLAAALWQAARLLGWPAAVAGGWLIALDPFQVALTRLLHPDSLMGWLSFLALVAWLNYLRECRRRELLLASLAAGLAWLTKSPAFFLGPFFALSGAVAWLWRRRVAPTAAWVELRRLALVLVAWAALAALVFVMLWPAMWVAPLDSLRGVFGEALNYAAAGHQEPVFFNGQIYPEGDAPLTFYPLTFLWRSTPVVWLGLALAAAVLFLPRREGDASRAGGALLALLVYAALFGLMMALGSKQFDRYLQPAYPPLELIAGWGWVTALARLPRLAASMRWKRVLSWAASGVLVVAAGLQAQAVVASAPYYLTYYNPLLGGPGRAGEVMMIGWGEGLDEAGRYLTEHLKIEKLRATSWYPDGPFSYYFDGQTLYDDLPADPYLLPKVDYVVIYAHQWQRQLPSAEFLAYFDALEPEHCVQLAGIEYACLYRLEERIGGE